MASLICDLLLFKIRNDYLDIYNLKPALYDKLDDFYTSYKSGNGLLKTSIVIELLDHIIKRRNEQITVKRADIERTTNLIDQNKDGFINFNELIDLLNLLLTDKRKIAIRIEQYLTNKDRLNSLSRQEACDHLAFLNQFYSPGSSSLIKAHKEWFKFNRLFNLLNKLNLENTAELKTTLVFANENFTTKNEFSRQLSKYYHDSAFVQY